jgi:hypothetical protein
VEGWGLLGWGGRWNGRLVVLECEEDVMVVQCWCALDLYTAVPSF